MKPAAAEQALPRRAVGLVLLALAAAAAPHLGHLPLPIVLFALACGLWRWMAAHAGWPLPGAAVRVLLAALALSGVSMTFGTVFGRDPGTALLTAMLGLKLLELRGYRDAMLILFLGCFLVVVMAFHSQELPAAAALVGALLLIVAATIDLNHPAAARQGPARLPLRSAGLMMLQALPLMLFMFVLFPRLPAPLWGLPADAHDGATGLSETMAPGSVSQLAGSDAVAFRVTFEEEELPPAESLYWRGPVFWHTDGRNWSGDAQRLPPRPAAGPRFTPAGVPVRYAVMLEPSRQRWLFALDLPYTAPEGATHTDDLFLLADRPVRELRRYAVTSYSAFRTAALEPRERQRALQLPAANPRSVALGRSWRDEADSDEALVQRALAHFRFEPFHYTLSPPLLGEDPVDEFLFESRRGFCEHYAAAFTVLMRAAGVPARVVTGYQGGELNPIGGFLVVRQRDAHAWAEVWLEGRGWTRVDPTAAVAPERIARGGSELLGRDGARARSGLAGGMVGDLLERASQGWDALSIRWDAWVLAYGPDVQAALLGRLGLRSWLALALGMAAALVLVLLLLALALQRRRRDPLAELHGRFRAKLARRGVAAAPSEGPMAYAARARARCPELADRIDRITGLYVAMRYGRNYAPQDIRRLRRAVADFRP